MANLSGKRVLREVSKGKNFPKVDGKQVNLLSQTPPRAKFSGRNNKQIGRRRPELSDGNGAQFRAEPAATWHPTVVSLPGRRRKEKLGVLENDQSDKTMPGGKGH
ncbi:hypothetical protein H6P81_016435 [Aristolochia fimbriata]|uniref:Uncharacterized protein n=1 Tax=Aristolochia fimbriata TaxID=158543 RepID=A0AAV7E889_ARIFI|nr:hypothetical protein H6P81_016435 [Aristolochia fimbriata]